MYWIVFNRDTPQEMRMIYVLAALGDVPGPLRIGPRNDWLEFEDKWRE
jgi:hypothetical protein